jgi:hypothetical protein
MLLRNETFKISLFLLEGVKIDFENTKRVSDVKAGKRKTTTKIRDQGFLVRGIPPSPNISRIIGHTWKWRLL